MPAPSCPHGGTLHGGVATSSADSPAATVIACANARGEGIGGSAWQRVRPRPGQADVRPIGWEVARVAHDTRTVTIRFTSGIEPCNVLDHVRTTSTRDAVTITLFEGSAPNSAGVACIEIGVLKSVRVVLDAALAGRRLVDGFAA